MLGSPPLRTLRAAIACGVLVCSTSALGQAPVEASTEPPEPTPQAPDTKQAEPEQAAGAGPATAEQAGDAVEPLTDTQLEATELMPEELDESTPSVSAQVSQAEAQQEAALRVQLAEATRERQDSSTLLPWIVLATGIAAVAVGTTLGVARTLDCDASCTSPFWPSWLLVGGTAVATGGLVWLKLAHEDQAELDSQRKRIERQLEGYAREREPTTGSLGARLEVRGRL